MVCLFAHEGFNLYQWVRKYQSIHTKQPYNTEVQLLPRWHQPIELFEEVQDDAQTLWKSRLAFESEEKPTITGNIVAEVTDPLGVGHGHLEKQSRAVRPEAVRDSGLL